MSVLEKDPRRLRARSDEAGFTLIELMVVMLIMSALAGLSVSGWTSFQRKADHKGTSTDLVSVLRNAQQSAYAEATTYCVRFATGTSTYQLFRGSCAAGTAVGDTRRTQNPRVIFESADFKQSDGTMAPSVSFTPRGSATKGTVVIASTETAKRYTISVEGLTGRVSLN